MLIEDDSLYLYHLTLHPPSASVRLVVGLFSGQKKVQELVVVLSTHIQIYRPNADTAKVEKLAHQHAFGVIQDVAVVRLQGSQQDSLVLTSDSGKIVVAVLEASGFVPVSQEPHSKNGLRRTSPGEYLSVDPQGRAILVSAIEKNKLLYKVQASPRGTVELSSPLLAVSKNTLTLKTVALDTNYNNPMFAALEINQDLYEHQPFTLVSPLHLNYYEFDQGNNHIIRRKSALHPDLTLSLASCLVPLPGHIGGLFVGCKNYLVYCHPQRPQKIVPLPVRRNSLGTTLLASVTHKLKKQNFLILCQSTLGDLFKITVDFNEDTDTLEDVHVKYFDTIPLCTSLNVLRSGFLFADVATDSKLFYQFESLSDGPDATSVHAYSDFPDLEAIDSAEAIASRSFDPKQLENLALVDVVESLGPLMQGAIVEASTAGPDPVKQFVTLSSAKLKTLTHGIPTSTVISTPCPEIIPTNVYTTKLHRDETNDAYLVLSSSASSQTLVLSIGEEIELNETSQFILDKHTVAVQQVGRSSVVQIHSFGIRHIKHTGTEKKTTDWETPGGISITRASTNNEQVIIALSNREVRYFEVDPEDDQLREYQDSLEIEDGAVTAVALPSATDVRKSTYAIIGTSDETVRVVSLRPHNTLETLTLQALSANSSSIMVLHHNHISYVHIGMENGVYVRAIIDEISGKLSDTRVKYLGSKPVQMSVVGLPQLTQRAILAVSSRPWVAYNYRNIFKVTPLMDISITTGVSFFSEELGGEGIVGLSGANMTIFTIGSTDEGEEFNVNNDFAIESVDLRYTPRRMILEEHLAFVLESEHNIRLPYPPLEEAKDVDVSYGYDREPGAWASCLQGIDLSTKQVVLSVELPHEHMISICTVQFKPKLKHIVVGSASGAIYTFEAGAAPKYIHKTVLDGPPSAVLDMGGRLLVAVKNSLRIYELGQKQLLRKANTVIPHLNTIVRLLHQGGNVFVAGDSRNSTLFVKYDLVTNKFVAFSDDVMQRQITAVGSLDSTTVIGGDKFGNCFVARLPVGVASLVNHDTSLKFQETFLNASGSRLRNLCEFHLQDIPTSFTKGSFIVGGQEGVYYTGVQGTVGLLMPIITKHEIELLVKLEIRIRQALDFNFDDHTKDQGVNLLGKDHLKFRSYYNPAKNVIDGDLLERYNELPVGARVKIANEVDRTPKEIEKKLSDLRNRSAF